MQKIAMGIPKTHSSILPCIGLKKMVGFLKKWELRNE